MKASDLIAGRLADQGVTRVYEVVGGMITHLIDSIHRQGRIELVSVRHEQAAAFAADGAGRLTGVPGVAMATSGPGATNLLTGIGSCYFDSSPAVFITGQVNRHERKGERPIRQLGFQETDIVTMAAPITKAAIRVETPEEVVVVLDHAFELARAGRPGPVLLDIPMDVQGADVEEPDALELPERPQTPGGLERAVAGVLDDLAAAERPLILVGAGVRCAGAVQRLRDVVTALQIPVVNSLLAVDVIPAADPMRAGLIGSYGNRWANIALSECDMLLVLGSRLDIRQTGADVDAFERGRVIHHVDVDPGELNNRLSDSRTIAADVADFLAVLEGPALARGALDTTAWCERLSELRGRWPDTAELADIAGINPNELMHLLSRASGPAGGYVVDVGQHQQWAAQSLELGPGQRFLTSGGMGAMGFALPAALGAVGAVPGAPWVVIAGDGAFQLNLQELQTVVHHEMPLKIVILDNGVHGMVRQFQETYFGARYQSTWWGYSAPDFTRVADAFGIASAAAKDIGELADGLARLWADPHSPFLLRVVIDPLANAYPKLAFGRPITEMEPFAVPVAMEGT